MSIEERYAKAIRTSHLEVEEAPGDADMVIAAGMSESLGVLLARLKAEWDSAAGDVGLYKRAQMEWRHLAEQAGASASECAGNVERASKLLSSAKEDDKAGIEQQIAAKKAAQKRFIAESERFKAEAERESLTARALILMNLRSLSLVKQCLYDFAAKQAGSKGVQDPSAGPREELQKLTTKLGEKMDAEARHQLIQDHSAKCREVADLAVEHSKRIAALVGHVLDVWLDRICHHCDGRGFTGGYGTPRLACRHCREAGSRRRSQLSDRISEHQFGLWLLNVLDSKCNGSMAQMSRKVRPQ